MRRGGEAIRRNDKIGTMIDAPCFVATNHYSESMTTTPNELMTPEHEHEHEQELLKICLKIYKRKLSLKPISKFLGRVDCVDPEFWDSILIPEIKRRYFPDMTIEMLIKKSMELYRATPDRALALQLIWEKTEWVYPFNIESFEEFIDGLVEQLENDPNPPTQSDWDELDECLLK